MDLGVECRGFIANPAGNICSKYECCDQQNNDRDCGLFSTATATELAFKGDPGTVSGDSTDCRWFPVYIALRYLYGPVKLDWFPSIDLLSDCIDKLRGKTHSPRSRCTACKLNTLERSDDLSNKPR